MRLRIDLAYDGTDFHGWATQPGLRTVQDKVEAALATALRVPRVTVVCAGRTDAGVHARGQVVHTDVDVVLVPREMERLARRLSGILPSDVHVRRAGEAPPGFDARYSALWRRYAYRVADSPQLVDPLTRDHVLVWSRELDLDAMNAASAALLGRHDFAAFCRRRPGATTIRTLLDLEWSRDEWGLASASVRADAFCHSMVRALVGCLIAIGEGRRPITWAEEILDAGVRDPSVIVAHARGLTLEQVAYPPDEDLLERALETRTRRVSLD
ncbi:MAG: tRNA pseudouridine(38-40) synthase TruA [Nocardioides sp.]